MKRPTGYKIRPTCYLWETRGLNFARSKEITNIFTAWKNLPTIAADIEERQFKAYSYYLVVMTIKRFSLALTVHFITQYIAFNLANILAVVALRQTLEEMSSTLCKPAERLCRDQISVKQKHTYGLSLCVEEKRYALSYSVLVTPISTLVTGTTAATFYSFEKVLQS